MVSRLAALLLCAPLAAAAQPAEPLRLADLRATAEVRDPRTVQPELLARASALRLENLRAQRLPQLAVTGQGTAQSDAASVPIAQPGVATPSAPRLQARLQAEADWAVVDGGRLGLQADLERARLAEQTAGVAVALYGLRDATADAFFGALLFGAQAETFALTARDLEARLALARQRVADGAALPSDAAALEAELIGARQLIAEAVADRAAALDVLAGLTRVPVSIRDSLALPDLDSAFACAGYGFPDSLAVSIELVRRPEVARFARTEERARAEALLAAAATRPSLNVFGQAGVGRPSPFDFLSREVKPYALVGVRFRWAPLDYGQARRAAEAALVQADVAESEARAFDQALRRQVLADAADAERLADAAQADLRVVALREEILRVARVQLDEGVRLPADYVDRLTDLAAARLTAARHRIERVRAQARVLSALGLFPDADLARRDPSIVWYPIDR